MFGDYYKAIQIIKNVPNSKISEELKLELINLFYGAINTEIEAFERELVANNITDVKLQ